VGHLLPERPVASLDEWLATDVGGLGLQRATDLGPDGVRDLVERSGLRGRGGGGFPTGRKWRTVASAAAPRYLVCNGAEGEPGTFKDRALLRANPYQLVEGLLIAALAVEVTDAYVAIKASFEREYEALTRAIGEMQEAGICRNCEIRLVQGPEEYLFGEEKGLLEVIEGNPPLPRLLPPYEHGLFATAVQTGWEGHEPDPDVRGRQGSNPTVVNNVETLSNLPHVLARGADWFRSLGTAESPGTFVCTVVGDVVAPDVGEVEAGTTLRQVIDAVGSGLPPGRDVKGVLSGVANPVVLPHDLDTPVSYEGFQAVGSGIGSCGFIVFDDTACAVEVARVMSRFLSVESCGQCPPCKLGSGEITARLERLQAGVAGDVDLETISYWVSRVTDGNRCYLAVEEQLVVSSLLQAFPDEFVAHIEQRGCPLPRTVELPKLVDLAGGVATIDRRQERKQPDWTYLPGPG
jgi:NADH:ubiquinone oxidoreductase subunit F (NADH-binding)